jgi:hypothetical protein
MKFENERILNIGKIFHFEKATTGFFTRSYKKNSFEYILFENIRV